MSAAGDKKKKTACVTGGNGYIASALIKMLLEQGYAVKTTVRNPDDMEKNSHFKGLRELGPLTVLRADLDEEGSFDDAVADCDYAFLVAAPVNMAAEDPEKEQIEPSVRGTLNVMRSCAKSGTVRRVILTSSAAGVYIRPELRGDGHILGEESWSDVDKMLLEKGYAVKTTVRNPDDMAKNSHLKDLQALGPLEVLRADLDAEGSFDDAVAGCDYAFLVAAPANLGAQDPEKELIEPAVRATLNVMRSCVKEGTVRRVVLTSSAAGVYIRPELQGDGHVLDEDSWSDVEHLRAAKPPLWWAYCVSKVLLEKPACRFAAEHGISLVTVCPVSTVGAAPAPIVSTSIPACLSFLSGDEAGLGALKGIEKTSGSVQLVHVDDLCRAELFVAEEDAAAGRYICCAVNTTVVELARFLAHKYPQYNVKTNFADDDQLLEKPRVSLSSGKLVREGFEFRYKTLDEMYHDMVGSKALGILPN